MTLQRCLAFILSLFLSAVGSPSLLAQKSQQPKTQEPQPKKGHLTVWAGFCLYKMEDFNNKLAAEGNKTIRNGLNAGIELSPGSLILKGPVSIGFPFGLEYLEASSKTTHTATEGSATVNWAVPVFGIYVAPAISIAKKPLDIYLRPVGVGYYSLGRVLRAKLTVTDRPGELALSADTAGIFSQLGIRYYNQQGFTIFLEGGYRRLMFTDISLRPKDDFTITPGGSPVQPGNLPQTLDYSGLIIRFGLGIKF